MLVQPSAQLDPTLPVSFCPSQEEVLLEAPPPSYETCQAQQDEPAPPSYDSLFGRVQAARQESVGTADFVKKVVKIIFSTVGWIIVVGLISFVPLAGLIIGALNLYDCPQEPKIPIYLIVFGILFLFICLGMGIFRIEKCCIKVMGEDNWEAFDDCISLPFGYSMLFLGACFICGNVWIYRIYNGYYDKNSSNYLVYDLDCDKTLYLFAFWSIAIVYLVPLVILVFFCCFAIVACFSTCICDDSSV